MLYLPFADFQVVSYLLRPDYRFAQPYLSTPDICVTFILALK